MIVWGVPSLSFEAANIPKVKKDEVCVMKIINVCSTRGEIKESNFWLE